jgi:choline dehydrogenase-like flavoprotein
VPELRPFYDVIVVGAGSAGAVVAQTLAALLPEQSILVIESGPALDTTAPVTREPANSANLFVAQSDGRRQQPPQAFTRTSALRSGEAQVPPQFAVPSPNYLQGRGWGGSGAINGLVCAPGKPADYNRWARDYGCTGWAWTDLAPTFSSLQSQLFLSTPAMHQPADRALLTAHTSLAFDQLNLKPAALSLAHGHRKLLSITDSNPSNLHVACGVDVIGILTESTTVRGVKLADGTELETNHVVLSAGAIGSPILLQRSGIGGSGVGQNLHDHTSISVTLQCQDPARYAEGQSVHSVQLEQPDKADQPGQSNHTGSSVYADSSVHVEQARAHPSVHTEYTNPSGGTDRLGHPDQSDQIRPAVQTNSVHAEHANPLRLDPLSPTNLVIESLDHIQILPVSLLPDDPTLCAWMASPFQAINGRGTVTALPNGTTRIQFDSFSDERDRAHLRNAARLLGQLLEQLDTSASSASSASSVAPFATSASSHSDTPAKTVDPRLNLGSEQLDTPPTRSTQSSSDPIARPVDPQLAESLSTRSDDELDTWVLNNQGSYYHAAGTCRMGSVDDPRSVVDPTCAVIGWSNISAIDASIFPDLPNANPYLPTVAIAKLAATRLAARLRT